MIDIILVGDPKKSKIKRFSKMVFSLEGLFAIFVFPLTTGVYTGLPISVAKFAFALSVLIVIWKIATGKIDLRKLPWVPIILFVAFAGYIILNGWPLKWGYPQKKAEVFAAYTAWSFLGAILILNTREKVARFLMISIWITAVLGGLGLIGFVTGFQVLYDPNAVAEGRAAVGVGNPIVLARAANSAILILAWMFLQANRQSKNTPNLLVLLIYFAIMVIASGSRGPAVGCVIAGGFLFVCSSFSPKAAARSFQLGLIVLIAGLAVTTVVSNTEKFDKVVDRIGELLIEGSRTTTFEYRRDAWELAYENFRESPATGHGIGGFKSVNYGTSTYFPEQRIYPHNIVWELLCEAGLVGLLLFVCLHISVIKLLFGRKQSDNGFATSLQGIAFALWLFYFINALSSGDLNDNRIMFCMLGLTANSAAWSKVEKKNTRQSLRSIGSVQSATTMYPHA